MAPHSKTQDSTQQNEPWSQAHEQACDRGDSLYQDPDSGLWVFTRKGLLDRGHCCHSGCRHCPYDEKNRNP